jgi:tetratricopeptide (TPR) repeat protein
MPAGLNVPKTWIRIALLAALLTPLAAAAQGVDETALRFYAAHGQRARAEAEGKRLAALHPGWRVPDDIWTARPGQADEKPLWALFASGDLDGLKRAIATRQRAEPGWRPSDDLARKLARKEMRITLLGKAKASQWLAVADLAGEFGKSGDVDDVELAWAVAEGFARSDRQPEAFALYAAILTRRSDAKERSATIHKAISLLPMADVELLLAMGKTDSNGAPEFAALAIDVTRGRIAALLHDERQTPLEPAELAAFETYAKSADDAGQAGLVAWLALKQNRTADALAWFKLAIARGGDAMIAHGLAHTLLRQGMRREAEEVAFAWREPLVNNAILFIDVLESELTKPIPPAIEPERLARYARVTLESRSGEGAQALGWYAYNSCQFETALDWFQRAGAWLPKEATIYGQALSLQRLKRQRDFIELVNRYDGLFPKVVALIFRDGRETPPGPCDQPRARMAEETIRPATLAAIRVPQPGSALAQEPNAAVKRGDFPIAVSPENPLRFPDAARGANEGFRPRGAEARPLVARRVGGVTAMPYEQLGFTLLPGWNGAAEPAGISVSEQRPARGTLWAASPAQTDAPARQGAPSEPHSGQGESAALRFRR